MPASEDFSVIPDAFGVPYLFFGNGGFLPGMPVVGNHNPSFAPAMQPTIRTGTEAAEKGDGWRQALERADSELHPYPEIVRFLSFIRESERGITV